MRGIMKFAKIHMEFPRERRLALKISEEILMPNVDKWKSISCAGRATGFQRDSGSSPKLFEISLSRRGSMSYEQKSREGAG